MQNQSIKREGVATNNVQTKAMANNGLPQPSSFILYLENHCTEFNRGLLQRVKETLHNTTEHERISG